MTLMMIVLAGLMGASGIILAAAAAHAASGAGLDSAAYMLLFHATFRATSMCCQNGKPHRSSSVR